MQLSSTKIEHRALNVLEAIINQHSTMEHQFSSNDKGMSWDGYINLFKRNNGDQTKANFDARVPVQIKGHNDPRHRYMDKNRIMWPVKLNDLKAFATEKGVLYFEIFSDDKSSEIFYASLYPSVIADYIDTASKKGNTASINIPFNKIEKNAEKLYIIAKQFSNEAVKQGTAFTPLVQNRIRINDFEKLTSINLSVVGANDSYDALLRLSTGDVCLYGKTDTDTFFRPLEWHNDTTFYVGRDVNQIISINGEEFYKTYKCIADSNGGMVLELSPNLELRLTEGRFNFKVLSTIRELHNDARFLLKLKSTESFEINGRKIKYTDPKIQSEFEKRLKYIIDLSETLEMIEFDLDSQITQYSEKQQSQFLKLVNLRLGAYNTTLEDGINKYNWRFGEKYYPLLVIKNNDKISLANSLYTNKYYSFIPINDDEGVKNYKMPLFLLNDIDVLCNLYNCDYDTFYKQIDESDINEKTASSLLDGALKLISVYDKNSDYKFLDIGDYILDKLECFISGDLILLNKMQIKKRKTGLNDKDYIVINSIKCDDEQVLFGKNVLLGKRQKAKEYYDHFSKEVRDLYVQLPIYEIYKNLK